MKKLIPLLVVFSSCVNQVQPYTFERVFFADPNCTFPEEGKSVTAAVLDVAAMGDSGPPAELILGIQITGLGYERPGLRLRTGETLERPMSSFPIFDTVIATYRTSRRIGTLAPFTQRRLIVASDPASENMFFANIISPEVARSLTDSLVPSTNLEDSIDLEVDLEVRGQINDSKTPITTGIITFPVRVVRSAPTACTGTQQFGRYIQPVMGGGTQVDFCYYIGQTPFTPVCCTPGDLGC